MSREAIGVITHKTGRPTDYLYRISLKGLIHDSSGKVLVVKESGRDWWDLPGGGMDHGESIKSALSRELNEEVCLRGNFEWKVLTCDEPKYLEEHNFWQLRLVVELKPDVFEFSPGIDADELRFADPLEFRNSNTKTEQMIYEYVNFLREGL